KLLSKQETVAAQIYDKLRFRIVTRSSEDIFPVVQFLSKKLFPFNYVIPAQSINSIFHFKNYVLQNQHLAPMLPSMQAGAADAVAQEEALNAYGLSLGAESSPVSLSHERIITGEKKRIRNRTIPPTPRAMPVWSAFLS